MPSQYPTPRFLPAYVTEPNGPRINKFKDLEPEWPGNIEKPMKDGGANYSILNTTPILRWDLVYDKVTETSSLYLSIIDDHHLECIGNALGFNFRHPETGVLYTDVHYQTFERDKTSNRRRSRHIVLIKRPTG